jgi:redox-sensitive bicupin YhaK (pirin superfamily)
MTSTPLASHPLRSVTGQFPAQRDDIADLITRRPLPGRGLDQVDPFLFLNHHGPQVYRPRNNGLPFGPHPHRGFETVTFILEGDIAHRDTGGHESVIDAGGVQWMTAGSGLVHEEVSSAEFKRDGGPLEVLQLWVNLPSRLKMSPPKYVGLQREDIPSLELDDGKVQLDLIAGAWAGQVAPIQSLTGITMTTLTLTAGARVQLDAPADRSVFFYLVRGALNVNGVPVAAQHLVTFAHDGDAIDVTADADAFLVFGHADPIKEPVVSHGPFVMTTRQEINEAIADYQAGKFGGF